MIDHAWNQLRRQIIDGIPPSPSEIAYIIERVPSDDIAELCVGDYSDKCKKIALNIRRQETEFIRNRRAAAEESERQEAENERQKQARIRREDRLEHARLVRNYWMGITFYLIGLGVPSYIAYRGMHGFWMCASLIVLFFFSLKFSAPAGCLGILLVVGITIAFLWAYYIGHISSLIYPIFRMMGL